MCDPDPPGHPGLCESRHCRFPAPQRGWDDLSPHDGVSAWGSFRKINDVAFPCFPKGGRYACRGCEAAETMVSMACAPEATSCCRARHHASCERVGCVEALQKHSSSLFRLATFRERLGVDYHTSLRQKLFRSCAACCKQRWSILCIPLTIVR